MSLCPNLRLQSKDPSLMNRYGVCVEKCPKQFETIEDYKDSGTKAVKGGQPMRRPDHPSWFLVESTVRHARNIERTIRTWTVPYATVQRETRMRKSVIS